MMNQHILALAEKALHESDFDDERNIKITLDIFAELVVHECLRLCRETENMLLSQGFREESFGAAEVASEIYQHFGVE